MAIKEIHGGCRVDGCERKAKSGGLCKMHYERVQSTGSTERKTTKSRLTDAQRDEIRRRMRRFEDPKAIAREMGCSTRTVRDVMKRKG